MILGLEGGVYIQFFRVRNTEKYLSEWRFKYPYQGYTGMKKKLTPPDTTVLCFQQDQKILNH